MADPFGAASSSKRFVILDRDGTIVEEKHHLTDARQLVLIPGAAEALRRLTRLGLGLVVVTNQSPIGRGILTHEGLGRIHAKLLSLLSDAGVPLAGIYYCPHAPQDECECRKPRTGLIEKAARELGFDPACCFMIGDNTSDIELGRTVGAVTFLVRTGHGASVEPSAGALADHVVDDLLAASNVIEGILKQERQSVGKYGIT